MSKRLSVTFVAIRRQFAALRRMNRSRRPAYATFIFFGASEEAVGKIRRKPERVTVRERREFAEPRRDRFRSVAGSHWFLRQMLQ
jgi:hypothetical protein